MKVRLGNYVKIKTGKLDANASSENGKYPFFTCSIQPLKINSYSYDCECVLVAGNGDLNVKYYNGKFDAYQRTYIIESLDKSVLSVPYLYCFLDKYIETLRFQSIGGVIKYIKLGNLTEAQIVLPNIQMQHSIVVKISKLKNLIILRKKQLKKLDELVKSRFVEMFGDLVQNPRKWRELNISEVLNGKVSNGFFAKRDDYTDEGNVSVLGVAYIVNRMYSQCTNLPKTFGSKKDIEKFQVRYGDLLFCRSSLVAEGIGKASVVPKNVPYGTLFECHVIRLQLDLEKCVPEFIQILTTTDYYRNQILAQSKTATMTTIGQDGILKTNILLPPLELQKQFLQFVEQVDKQKSSIQQSLDKLEVLKKALMQEYFG